MTSDFTLGVRYLGRAGSLKKVSVYFVRCVPIAFDLSTISLRMSPQSSKSKAARTGKNGPETSAKGGQSIGEAIHANVPSVSQATNHSGESSSTTRSSKKRPMSLHGEDLEREQKKPKKEHSVSANSNHSAKIENEKAISSRSDPVPKQPSPQSSTLKLSFGPLDEEVRTLRKLPLDEPDQLPRENERVRRVEERVYLDDEQVTLAIAAVTEVVNSYYNSDMYLWSLLSSTTLAATRQQPPWDRTLFPRLVRSKLVFPMFLGPKNLLCYPDVITDVDDNKTIRDSAQEHIFLVKVLFNRGELRLPQLVILDSSPGFLDRSSEEWQLAVSEMRRTVTNLGIWDPPSPQVTHVPSLESYQIVFEPEIEIPVARQQNSWACGVHTILNAWADALLFRTDPACEMNPASCKHAVDVINLVLQGRATLHLVANLLTYTGFVFLENKNRGQAITELRDGSKLLRYYHRINSTPDLDTLIANQNIEAMQRLEALTQENQLNSTLALSVAQTVLPRLRKIDLKEKVKAAKEAAKTRFDEGADEEEEQEQERKSRIGGATVLYFTDRVQQSSTATAYMNRFCQVLKSQGLIVDVDKGDIIGNDHKAEEATSREAKDEFIRLLGYYIENKKTEHWWKTADSDLLQLYFEVWLDTRIAKDNRRRA